jgi:hypothetical protein
MDNLIGAQMVTCALGMPIKFCMLFKDPKEAMITNEPLYLIMGATGATGGAAAKELRRVRGLGHKDEGRAEALRTSGIETVFGDLLDLDPIRVVEY